MEAFATPKLLFCFNALLEAPVTKAASSL